MAILTSILAGIPMESVVGSNTSVHVGCYLHDYEIMLQRDPNLDAKYKSTGTALAMLSNRISWFYNWSGPSISLDTACSSSLNALHLACQTLRSGEASMVGPFIPWISGKTILILSLTCEGYCRWLQFDLQPRHFHQYDGSIFSVSGWNKPQF